MDKVPAVPKVRREPRRLCDIRGPSREATDFIQGQYGILVSGTGPCSPRPELGRVGRGSPEGPGSVFGQPGQEAGRVQESAPPGWRPPSGAEPSHGL